MLDASGEDAYLVFGVPDSDDVGISLWCPIQRGEVNIYIPGAPAGVTSGQDVPVTVSAGDVSTTLTGRANKPEESDVTSVEATIPVDHSILAAMLEADRFKVKLGADETVFPLFDADLAGLIDLCRQR